MSRVIQGFTDRGTFNRPGTPSYVGKMTKPHMTPYVDSVMAKVLAEQGFKDVKLSDKDYANRYDPEQMYEALERYALPLNEHVDEDAYAIAFNKAFAAFSKETTSERLKVLKTSELPSAVHKSTSAGLGYIGNKLANMTIALRRMNDVINNRKAPNPCTAYTRTSRNNKTRLVWGYPLEMTLLEARFARPLIRRYLSSNTSIAFGQTALSLGSALRFRIKAKSKTVYALDYSKYDARVSDRLILDAFKILATWFTPEDRKLYAWDKLVHYFIRTPIVMPNGHLYVGKKRGIPSGSYFTQLVGSIVNFMSVSYMVERMGRSVSQQFIKVLGDDSIFGVNWREPISKFIRHAAELGLVIHSDKTKVNELHFLGAYWDRGLPDLDINELLRKALCPEKPRQHLYRRRTIYEKGLIAREILTNYASSYLSGWLMVRPYGNRMQAGNLFRCPDLWPVDENPFYSVKYAKGLKASALRDDPSLVKKFFAQRGLDVRITR